ncbi:MAG: alpha/beta fold hydrolase [Clostridiales bacterium]|nr:alpha/beta fold hydrolase [Clostridiales bacterium]
MKYVFIHGLGQTPVSWEKTIFYLSASKQDIICIDLVELLKGKIPVYENLYRACSEYLLGIDEQIQLCGLSLGGIIALQFTIEYPLKIKSLVLIGTQFVMPKRWIKFQNILFQFMPERAFSNMGFSKKDFIELSKSIMKLNFEQDIHRLECNTLILCGKKDIANRAAAFQLKENIPNAKLQFVKHAGHEINMDTPEKLGIILDRFYEVSFND